MLKKLISKTLILCTCITITGCGSSRIYKSDAEKEILKTLETRYNREFEILNVEEYTGMTAMSGNGYEADVLDIQTNKEFYASITNRGEYNGDTFAICVYSDLIEEILENIFNNYRYNLEINYDIVYDRTDKCYDKIEKLDDYLINTNTFASINILAKDNTDYTDDIVYELINDLADTYVQVTIVYDGVYIVLDEPSDSISYETFIEKLENRRNGNVSS